MPGSFTLDSVVNSCRDTDGVLTTDLDMLAQRVVPALGLNQEVFSSVFKELAQYWASLDMHENGYVVHAMQALATLEGRGLINGAAEWLEVGKYLADATHVTYGNGSHSFITGSVIAIARSQRITTKSEFTQAVDRLLHVVETLRPFGANGGNIYHNAAPQLEASGYIALPK